MNDLSDQLSLVAMRTAQGMAAWLPGLVIGDSLSVSPKQKAASESLDLYDYDISHNGSGVDSANTASLGTPGHTTDSTTDSTNTSSTHEGGRGGMPVTCAALKSCLH